MSSGRARLPLLCFALSGFSALVYQTAWTREFAFVFGTSELAVATVLAAYMGGLAVGAALAARLVAIVRRPLFSYGVLELGIGASALAVPHALRLATPLYVGIFGRAQIPENVGLASGLFYAGCAFVILGVPTALMGATLPLLARDAVQGDAELGSRVGRLYAVNTFGAVAGTVSTAFVLLPRIGLRATVAVAVALNGLIFALMAFAGRGSEAPRPARAAPGQRSPGRAILPLMLVSGAVSFTLEVLWTRLLEHVLGASVYAFATMLASFLVGIALGSAVAARFATRPERAVAGFAMAQLGTACLSLAAFVAVDRLPELARAMALAGGRRGVADPLVAGLTLLPSTLCIGATFPFAVRILARGEHDAGPASARVYAWNTVGAVLGALSAGFVLISALGLEGTLHAAVLASAALALAATLLVAPRRPVLAAIAGALLLAVAAIRPGLPWRLLRTSPLSLVPGWGPIEYYGSGRSATVLLMRQAGEWRLTTNGLPEAGIPAPGQPDALYRTERWLTALPLLARPDAQSMLVIGLGGGVAVEDVPRSVRVIEVAELEPDVVQANRSIATRWRTRASGCSPTTRAGPCCWRATASTSSSPSPRTPGPPQRRTSTRGSSSSSRGTASRAAGSCFSGSAPPSSTSPSSGSWSARWTPSSATCASTSRASPAGSCCSPPTLPSTWSSASRRPSPPRPRATPPSASADPRTSPPA
jgi:spermidine synthase